MSDHGTQRIKVEDQRRRTQRVARTRNTHERRVWAELRALSYESSDELETETVLNDPDPRVPAP